MSRVPRQASRDGAEAAWSALAPLIAGQPRMRLSRDGGRNYPTGHERVITKALPSVPAAVRITGSDGCVASICLDLDSSAGGQEQVDADYAAVTALFRRHGARWIEDVSPNGGRHLYLPLVPRIPFTEARVFVEALKSRLQSLDASPHQNAAAGCIRVPGSVHKSGGYQLLTMDLNTAYDIARRRNPAAVWESLRAALAEEIGAVTQRRTAELVLLEDTEYLPLPGGRRHIPGHKDQLARTGTYDTSRYDSPSEARQAVLASCAAAGWSLTDVLALMRRNTWAGMNSFYARYRSGQRAAALHRDWRKAVSYVATRRAAATHANDPQSPVVPVKKKATTTAVNGNGHKSYTSGHHTQGAFQPSFLAASSDPLTEHRFLRTWRNALPYAEQELAGTRSGLGYRMLLRAIGEAAHKAASRFIEFGVRSLALGTGTHATTVARQLRDLAARDGALIRLVQEARGTRGDVYELVLPTRYQDMAEAKPWARGRIHALRPVFRELGITAAFVYETIETNDGQLTSAETSRTARLSPTATTQALEILAAWHLIERIDGRWRIVTSTSLRALAEHFGVLEAVAAQHAAHRRERAAWHDWLNQRSIRQLDLLSPGDPYPFWLLHAPPEDDRTTLIDLIA